MVTIDIDETGICIEVDAAMDWLSLDEAKALAAQLATLIWQLEKQ